MPKLSIIVPVYNARNFLSRCIDSILNQTFEDFELILVDDGSTDGSGVILDEYRRNDGRILVIHNQNEGPGAARNTGLDNATGKWIGFVDSDDWIERETYKEVLAVAEEKNADLVQWELIMEYLDKSVPNKCKPEGFFAAEQSGIYYRSVVYASIYKKSIIENNNIRFPIESSLSEDALFNYQYYLKAKNCFYYGKCFYHFRQNPSSITHNVTKEMILGKKNVLDKIAELAGQNGGFEYVKNIKRNAKLQALHWLDKPDYTFFRELFPEIKLKDLFTDEMSFFAKIWYFLIYLRIDFLADFLYKLKKKHNKQEYSDEFNAKN